MMRTQNLTQQHFAKCYLNGKQALYHNFYTFILPLVIKEESYLKKQQENIKSDDMTQRFPFSDTQSQLLITDQRHNMIQPKEVFSGKCAKAF